MTKLKVIVADTDRDFCNSLRASLTDADGFELLAVTDSGVDAMEKVQRYQPDILIQGAEEAHRLFHALNIDALFCQIVHLFLRVYGTRTSPDRPFSQSVPGIGP